MANYDVNWLGNPIIAVGSPNSFARLQEKNGLVEAFAKDNQYHGRIYYCRATGGYYDKKESRYIEKCNYASFGILNSCT